MLRRAAAGAPETSNRHFILTPLRSKTTLVNRILTEQHGKKIAVIENEFGGWTWSGTNTSKEYTEAGLGQQLRVMESVEIRC